MLSSARLGAPFCVTSAALWRWLANFVACAAFPACGCTFAWHGQHFVAVGSISSRSACGAFCVVACSVGAHAGHGVEAPGDSNAVLVLKAFLAF